VKLEISKRARRHIEKRQAWWSEHRPLARSMFLDELAAAERPHRAGAGIDLRRAQRAHHPARAAPEDGNARHYSLDANRDLVTVLAVWGAQRGRTPRL
jgi:hypothetical protein